jgi:hypothetical protein
VFSNTLNLRHSLMFRDRYRNRIQKYTLQQRLLSWCLANVLIRR